ncbi:MAG: MFS transporter [bacterium]
MQTCPVRKREIFGWCCFDFANSAFTTVIITVIYSVYFNNVVAQGHPAAKSWWGIASAAAQTIAIVLSPWLGAVADFTARKKLFLMASAVICSLFTATLYGVGPGMVVLALILVSLANVAFSLSENFCASFLPEISTPETSGRISGYGWSFGYMGGLASLGLALAIIQYGEKYAPWTFPLTAVFFIVACLPTFFWLKERAKPQLLPAGFSFWKMGWKEVWRTTSRFSQHRTLAVFFVSFTFFMSGLWAIIAFAALFADEVLHFSQKETILLFVFLQISSAVGAFVFGFFQDKLGSKSALVTALLLWLVVSVWAFFCQTKTEFFIIGNLAGLGMGSLQSASRAVVAQLAPEGKSGEIFGFWGLFGKLGGVLGPLSMGVWATLFDFRLAALLNGLYFLAGLLILLKIPLRRAVSSN